MKVFCDVKVAVRAKECLLRKFALAVCIVAALVPHRIRPVCILSDVVRDVRDHQLRLRRDSIPLVVLKIVMIQFNFYFLHLLSPSCASPRVLLRSASVLPYAPPTAAETCGFSCRHVSSLHPPSRSRSDKLHLVFVARRVLMLCLLCKSKTLLRPLAGDILPRLGF